MSSVEAPGRISATEPCREARTSLRIPLTEAPQTQRPRLLCSLLRSGVAQGSAAGCTGVMVCRKRIGGGVRLASRLLSITEGVGGLVAIENLPRRGHA